MKAASLRAILERAFDPFDDDMRAALLAEPIAIAVDLAHRGDEATLRRAVAAIQKACKDAADAWFAAQPAG